MALSQLSEGGRDTGEGRQEISPSHLAPYDGTNKPAGALYGHHIIGKTPSLTHA